MVPLKSRGPALRGSIHDIQYLFAGIRGLLIENSIADEKKYIETTKNEIMEYNSRMAEKYNLRKPRKIGDKVTRDVIKELEELNIVTLRNGNFRFTDTGNYLASLMMDGRVKEFRAEMTKLMLNRYHQLQFFLKRIYELTNGYGQIAIPRVPSRVFYEVYRGDVESLSKHLIQSSSKVLVQKFRTKLGVEDLTRRLNQCLKRHEKDMIRKMQIEIDRYFVSHMFEPNIVNKRTYDVIRDICASLFLINYGLFEIDSFPVELVYLKSWLAPFMKVPPTVWEVSQIILDKGNKLLIHNPTSRGFREKMITVAPVMTNSGGTMRRMEP